MNHCEAPGITAFLAALSFVTRTRSDLADKNFELLKTDPHHPSLHFKKIGELWSVRVALIIERYD